VSERFLLCRPEGGFNDMLCQIELCWRYAEAHNRTLIVDSTATVFGDVFGNYFRLADGQHAELQLTPERLQQLNAASVFPEAVQGRIDGYTKIWSEHAWGFVDASSHEPLSFDNGRDYAQTVLLHQQHGGGTVSVDALRRLRLQPELAQYIRGRIAGLGADYDAIHVRHTDYITDLGQFFGSLAGKLAGRRVLVCSDNAEVIALARQTFKRAEIVTVSDVPDLGGRPIHLHGKAAGVPAFDLNRDMLTDLLALAASAHLYVSRVLDGPGGRLPYQQLSGFSYLAMSLNQSRKLLKKLLAAD
jgi:hypothetical protein